MNRAFSVLAIKSFDDDERTFEGIASTPSPDRGEDIVDPKGAVFKLPIPLLWQHGKGSMKDPIGAVTSAKVTSDGISVKGYFAKLSEPPSLKDDLDRAWALAKSGIVRGLSVGFRPLDWDPIKNSMGVYHKLWEWLELSVVIIPMQAEANIVTIKSIDDEYLRDRLVGNAGPEIFVRSTSPVVSGAKSGHRGPVKLIPRKYQ